MNWVERALDASPDYTYAHYLKGRLLTAQGLLGPAQEAYAQALRQRDDFVLALAETAAVYARMAREIGGPEQAANAVAAMRYTDRATRLMATKVASLYERQGRARYFAADLPGAALAFATARDSTADDGLKRLAQAGLAVVDYAQERTDDALAQLDRLIRDLPREHAIRQWAEATRALIDDHAQKELLGDRFERDDLGNVWEPNRDDKLGPRLADHRLLFSGHFSKANTEVSARRIGAVPKGGRFLAVGARMQLGAAHDRQQETFAGLRIETRSGTAGAADFVARLGFRGGKPYLEIVDGREEPVRLELPDADADAARPHALEFRVEPRDDKGTQFALLALWDDAVVHRQDLKLLRGQSPNELRTLLVVEGTAKGAGVDVAFDDYRLERRKEN
jgi:tetratricopeptide (TPR) repeat protein